MTLIPITLFRDMNVGRALYSEPVQKHTAATNKHRPYSSHLHLGDRRKGQMCAHTQLQQKTTKRGMLIGQMGLSSCVHALASINITTEDHSCESSLVSAPNGRTHLTSKKRDHSQTNMKVCSTGVRFTD